MNWIILVIAGLFEVGWAVGLKYTEGFTRFWPSVATVGAIMVSMLLLGFALKTLPIGVAYGIWVGIGIIGTALAGVLLLGEPVNPGKMLGLTLIVAGIILLKTGSAAA